ncbi:Spy/CpxP family protein refolding chaperone [Psychrobacter sp. NG25]|uniref:Spy/CpxP family protein refolding chaperone n=1 Tax=Psychrobacter sp. NG25 TaxID=2782005 RepID=UPI001883D7A7|nr:Spy/CpxP family protein refolding chaperone [Psychrobacter sp. NG25]MBF0659017.1 Spy/CpxP family protein refolding chaperone [Psychrobacter sp. NG25]
MKKLLLGSVLALSSVFTVTACTSVNANTDTTPSTTKMQKQHKAGMKKGDMKKGGMRGPLSQLDLTEAQQTQIKAIMQKQHGDNKADRTENKAERAQMHQQIQALTNARTLNNAAVSRLADQQAAKEKQRFIERVQTQHAIAQVLTAEQRAELAQMKEDKKGDREPRGERPQPGM